MFCSKCGFNNNPKAKFCISCGTPLALASEPAIQQPVEPEIQKSVEPAIQQPATSAKTLKFAGFWFRTFALVIDTVLCNVVITVILLPFAFVFQVLMAVDTPNTVYTKAVLFILMSVIAMLLHWLWFTIAESSKWQATIGKKMVGLKVTDENGERIDFGRANGRYWSKTLSYITLLVGFVMAAFTEKKQGLHDKIAGTLVVKETLANNHNAELITMKRIFYFFAISQFAATFYYMKLILDLVNVGSISVLAIFLYITFSLCLYIGVIKFTVNNSKGKVLFLTSSIGLIIASMLMTWPYPWALVTAFGSIVAILGYWIARKSGSATTNAA
jgi:uncharacterized RDD family membrane protein YckC